MCLTIGYLIRKNNEKKKREAEQGAGGYDQPPRKPEYPPNGMVEPTGGYATHGNGVLPPSNGPPYGQQPPMAQQPMR